MFFYHSSQNYYYFLIFTILPLMLQKVSWLKNMLTLRLHGCLLQSLACLHLVSQRYSLPHCISFDRRPQRQYLVTVAKHCKQNIQNQHKGTPPKRYHILSHICLCDNVGYKNVVHILKVCHTYFHTMEFLRYKVVCRKTSRKSRYDVLSRHRTHNCQRGKSPSNCGFRNPEAYRKSKKCKNIYPILLAWCRYYLFTLPNR